MRANSETTPAGRFLKQISIVGIATIVSLLAVASFLTWTVKEEVQAIVDTQIEVLTAAEQVEHYGTVLDLSIKSVVATGDPEAAARYRAVQPRLRQIITGLRNAVQLEPNKLSAAEIDRADLTLISLEYEALELAARGRLPEARALIHSDEYKRPSSLYFDGIYQIERRAVQRVQQLKQRLRRHLSSLVIQTAVFAALLLVAWLALARKARTWVLDLEQERARAEQMMVSLTSSQEQLEQANELLLEQVSVDSLTGLQSRRKLNHDLLEIVRRMDDGGESFSLVMCDVDNFKQYNDTYGHPAGDEVLKAIAHAFRGASRPDDKIYRYGGEEFLLIMGTASLEAGTVCAERYRSAVEQMRIPHNGSSSGYVTVSMGVTQLEPGRPLPVNVWVERADGALYEAKRRGRNQVYNGKLAAA